MDLNGIGYSNIRLPNNSLNGVYIYNKNINTFPEEVFIHEFLHTLERELKERHYDIPNLHDNEKYGYKMERLIGLKNWYNDYMTCNIETEDGSKLGLNKIVYTLTPSAESDFNNAKQIQFLAKSKNILNEMENIFKTLLNEFIYNK